MTKKINKRASAIPIQLRLPEYTREILPNGITLLLLEKHELPVISFEILFRGGSVLDPVGKEGLAATTLALLRKGSEHRSAQQFSDKLDFVGGIFSTGQMLECSQISMDFVSTDYMLALDLLTEALLNPTFPQVEFDKIIRQSIDASRQMKDNPNSVMQYYYESFLFAGHPYGRCEGGTETSLPNITRNDVFDYYRRHYIPQNMMIAIVGDFSSEKMMDEIAKRFGSWQQTDARSSEVVTPGKPNAASVLLIDKPDEAQAYFNFGSVGVQFNHPDYAGIDVVETILGGSFVSWINSALRLQGGLTYGARAFTYRHRKPGPFTIASYTGIDEAQQAIDLCLSQLQRLHQKGIDTDELQRTVNYIKGQYPSALETINQLAGLLCDLEFYNVGPEMINSYFSRLDALTVDEVNRIATSCFPQDKLVFAIAGPASKLRKTAERYGPVEEIKMSAPGFYRFTE